MTRFDCNRLCNLEVMKWFIKNHEVTWNYLTGYGFMLPCMRFMHLALLDHSTPDCARCGQSVAWCWRATYKVVILSCRENYVLALSPHFDIGCIITKFAFKLLANYEGNYVCHRRLNHYCHYILIFIAS